MPLTGARVVQQVITDLAVSEVTANGLVLREVAPGVAVAEVLEATGAALIVPPNYRPQLGGERRSLGSDRAGFGLVTTRGCRQRCVRPCGRSPWTNQVVELTKAQLAAGGLPALPS